MTFSTAAAPVGLGLPRNEVLWMLMMAVIGFGVMVPVAGLLADAFGRRKSMVIITTLIILFALFAFNPLLGSGNPILVFAFLLLGLSLMGLTFGPLIARGAVAAALATLVTPAAALLALISPSEGEANQCRTILSQMKK
ncbi:hypothetical protein AWF03_26020 [Escherichia coli]|nr:hypothetical protein AWF03_26020 [Escherichia coli]